MSGTRQLRTLTSAHTTMIVLRVILFLGLGALAAGSAIGGVGADVSPIATVDTRAPVLTVVMTPVQSLYQGGQSIRFTIRTEDDNPGDPATDHAAEILDADTVLDAIPFDPLPEGHVYDWPVPELSSAQVRLVATSRDSFGNVGTVETPTFVVIPSVTDVLPAPARLRFGPAHPNPFNPRVNFRIELPEAGQIQLRVFDARGRQVRDLMRENRPAGPLEVSWEGTDGNGIRQPGGVYFFEMTFRNGTSSFRISQKAVLLP